MVMPSLADPVSGVKRPAAVLRAEIQKEHRDLVWIENGDELFEPIVRKICLISFFKT